MNYQEEYIKATKTIDKLTSENVDLKVKICDRDVQLHHLLTEVHERMYTIMEHCERLQPVKLGYIHNGYDDPEPITVDLSRINLTDKEEMLKTKLFRLVDKEKMTSYDDQTSRSILKDLRKVIKSLEKEIKTDDKVNKQYQEIKKFLEHETE